MIYKLNSLIRLIKKLSLSDSSRTAYVKNQEVHSSLLTQNITPVSLPKAAALEQLTDRNPEYRHRSAVSVFSTTGSLLPTQCSTII